MKRKKPLREFRVAFVYQGIKFTGKAVGETFFAARAAYAVQFDLEPGDIRLDPPRRYEP